MNHKKNKQNKKINRLTRTGKGFTLTEVLVTMSVFTLIMFLTGMILQEGQTQVEASDTKTNLQEANREGLYRMGLEVRETSLARVSITQGGKALTFQIPASVADSGVISWSNSITYQRNGTQLVRIDSGTGETTVLANNVQDVNFSTTGSPGRVIFSLTARRTMTNGRALSAISTGEANPRNV